MQPFIVSLLAGVCVPLLPLAAEAGLTNQVQPENWALTAIVYVAAVGLCSRNQAIMVAGLVLSSFCGFLYAGILLRGQSQPPVFFAAYGPVLSQCLIGSFVVAFIIERYGRHCVDGELFLEAI